MREKNKRRGRSILSKIVAPMLLLGLMQGIVFFSVMVFSGELGYIEQYSCDILTEKTANRASYMTSLLTQKTSLTEQAAEEISELISDTLSEKGGTITDKETCESILRQSTARLIELMHSNVVNDAYIVLETGDLYGENIRPGLYLRDTDAYESGKSTNSDISMEMGSSDIARENSIALDYEWMPTLDLSNGNSFDFYTVPISACREGGGKGGGDYGYWSGFSGISHSSKESIKYTVPLVGKSGEIYGVLGIGLLEKTIINAMPQSDFSNDYSCYILGADFDGSGDYTPVMHSGAIYSRLASTNPTYSDENANKYGLCTFYSSSGKEYLGSIQTVDIYGQDSPYIGQRWAIISAADAATTMKAYNFMVMIMIITIVTGFVVSLLFSLYTGRRISRPVARMIAKLHKIRPGDEDVSFDSSGVAEVDDLAESVSQLQKNTNEYAMRVSSIINLTNSGIGIFMCETRKNSVFLGESLIKLLGMDSLPQRDVTISMEEFSEVIKGVDTDSPLPDFSTFADKMGKEGRTAEFRCSIHGEQRWFKMMAAGITTGVIGIIQDITNTVTEKEKIAKDKDDEYTERLLQTNHALQEAYHSAIRANAAKTDFLSRMSHDIRTPMNAIIGMTTIAEANIEDGAKVADCLNKISSSGRYLLSLINDVLDMSKIESGSFTLAEDKFSISGLADESVEIVLPSAKEKGHSLVLQKHDIIHDNVVGDKLRIQQIFMNIIGNAIKYTPDGGKITVDLSEKQSDKKQIGCYEIVFQDNGIGMSQEFMKKIFEPFERAEDDRVNKVQGTGLGMTITYNIVKMMGGEIAVTSEQGKGSCFYVLLYLKTQETAPAAHTPADTGGVYELENSDFSGFTVLLADDNELNRDIAAEIFSMTGLTVEQARDGKEAVDMFAASAPGHYAAIFMDVQMPVMDGYEASRTIRAMHREDAATIPIFAMTANAFAEDIKDAMDAGMNEHLAKPVEISRLLQVMNKWLKAKPHDKKESENETQI